MLYWIPVLLSLVATYLLLHTLYESYDLNFADVEFGDFQLHPSSMGLGFILLAPLAALSYRIVEFRLGFCHTAAKFLHGVLNFLALILGLLGVSSMYKTHESKSHFQTIHSWLGIVVLCAFTCQFLSALVVLFLVDNAALRAKFVPYHKAFGIVIVLSALCISILGMQSMVWKRSKDGGSSTDEAWMNINIASSIVASMILILAFSLYGGGGGARNRKQFHYKPVRNHGV